MKPFCCHVILAGVCASALLLQACRSSANEQPAKEQSTEEEEGNPIIPSITTDTLNGIDQEYRSNRRWNEDIEANFYFVRMYADTSGNTYALGYMGGIFHRARGKDWERETLPADYVKLFDITGDGDDIYAVGEKQTVFHKKAGQPWTLMSTKPTARALEKVYSYNGSLWAASKKQLFYKKAGGDWQELPLGEKESILSITGEKEDVWAVGKGCIYHSASGTTWSRSLTPPDKSTINAICKCGSRTYALGSGGTILYKEGSQDWKQEGQGLTKENIFCAYSHDDEIYAGGTNGLVLHRSTGKWNKEWKAMPGIHLNTAYGDKGQVWMGGNNNMILHTAGDGRWTKETSMVKGVQLLDLAGGQDGIYAAGAYETLLHRADNGTWIREQAILPDTPLTGVFTYDKDILVAGRGGNLFHRGLNGQWWREDSHAGNARINDLYSGTDSIYMVGEEGMILSRAKNDTVWHRQVISEGVTLGRTYGYDDDIWIMGSNSMLLHKKNKDPHWTTVDIGEEEMTFFNMYQWKGHIWLLGIKDGLGLVYHRQPEGKWSKEELNAHENHFHEIYGRNDTIWLVGGTGHRSDQYITNEEYSGAIFCKEGNNPWKKQEEKVSNIHFMSVKGEGDEVYALGNGGALWHKKGNEDWVWEETFHNGDLKKILLYKGLFIQSSRGVLYRDADNGNYININQFGNVIDMVLLGDELFLISTTHIYKASPGEEKYPYIRNFSYSDVSAIEPDLRIRFAIKFPRVLTDDGQSTLQIYARAYNDDENKMENYKAVGADFKSQVDSSRHEFIITTNFDVQDNFHIIPGHDNTDKLSLRIDLSSSDGQARESFVIHDEDGNPYITIRDDTWKKYKAVIISLLGLIGIHLFWILLWWFAPLVFLKAYRKWDLFSQQDVLGARLHLLAKLAFIVAPLRSWVDTPHVLNAWIKANKNKLEERFENSQMVRSRATYVPLPCRLKDHAGEKFIDQPDHTLLPRLFEKERTLIQILGPGGAGKTTLAVAMGRWLIRTSGQWQRGMHCMPVIVEADKEKLLDTVTRTLRAWLNDDTIPEDFVRTLLKRQRLAVIVDALSESSANMQHYYETIHGEVLVNALIITSRHHIEIKASESVSLYPAPLDAAHLLHFIETYLANYPDPPLKTGSAQFDFAKRISVIVGGEDGRTAVPAILVKLIIDLTFRKGEDSFSNFQSGMYTAGDFQTLLEGMPGSVPEVYYQYLCMINPNNPAAPNYLPHEQMLRAAELLGKLSLGRQFIPRDFLKKEALKVIDTVYPGLGERAIHRLVDNGVLTERTLLGDGGHSGPESATWLRFNLDPLAEYLGASWLFDEYTSRENQLDLLAARVEAGGDKASEFKSVFEHVKAYKLRYS